MQKHSCNSFVYTCCVCGANKENEIAYHCTKRECYPFIVCQTCQSKSESFPPSKCGIHDLVEIENYLLCI